MSLLAKTIAALGSAGVRHAVIGAAALAAHGVTRATADVDLLTTDSRSLASQFWTAISATGVDVEVRRGDAEDPLAGVVRISAVGESPVDLIVGRSAWQDAIVRRAVPTTIAGAVVPIVDAPDLVLLKLYAGGSQDAWDVDQLLDAVPGIRPEVERRLGDLPTECAAMWRRILDAHARTP